MRYYIEQAQNRFYSGSDLDLAKARAARMSQRLSSGVYLIAEQFNRETRDYDPVGSIAYYGGLQDAKEGCSA